MYAVIGLDGYSIVLTGQKEVQCKNNASYPALNVVYYLVNQLKKEKNR